MLRESISDRQLILDAMIRVIKKDEKELSAQTAAISHLEATIWAAERALTTQKSTLSSLEQLQGNLNPDQDDNQFDWTTPSEVNQRCKTTIAHVDAQLSLGALGLADSISRLKEYLPLLSVSIQEMKGELSSRRFMRDALSKYIFDTRNHEDTTKRNIEILRSLFKNVKHIPAEVWAKIFSLRVHADLVESMDYTGSTRTLDTAMKLSQVCRFWRSIACSTRSLWGFIPVYAASGWPRGTLEYLKYSGSLAPAIPVLLCDLLQSPGRWSGTGIVDDGIFELYSTQVFVKMSRVYWPNLSFIPFRRPKLLGLHFDSKEGQEGLNNLLDAFSGYTSLEILFKGDYHQTLPSSVNIPAEVTHLTLDFTTAFSFEITRNLSQNLQELHIKHDRWDVSPSIATPLQLPRLEVLGITPTDTSFAESAELPSLKKLVLYGPRLLGDPFPSLSQIAETTPFERVLQLEVRDWSLCEKPDMFIWSIMTPLSDMVEKMRSVESLRCVDSGVQGSQLVELVTALKSPTNPAGSRLKNIFIDCCTGITRDQCDAVGQMVQKLEVYV